MQYADNLHILFDDPIEDQIGRRAQNSCAGRNFRPFDPCFRKRIEDFDAVFESLINPIRGSTIACGNVFPNIQEIEARANGMADCHALFVGFCRCAAPRGRPQFHKVKHTGVAAFDSSAPSLAQPIDAIRFVLVCPLQQAQRLADNLARG